MKTVILIATFSILMAGCNGSNIFGQKSQINLVPTTFENPKETRGTPSDAPADDYDLLNLPEVDPADPLPESATPSTKTPSLITDASQTTPTTQTPAPVPVTAQAPAVKPPAPAMPTAPAVKPPTAETPAKPKPPVVQAQAPAQPITPTALLKKPTSLYDRASTFVKNTIWVMVNEGKKIGTPCNFFLRRVLEVSGFAKASFRANDFDDYADKYFSSAKEQTFKSVKNERERLRQYLWSFPSSTPFIMNWHRDGVKYGHVAIVERYDNDLVIYQASIGSHSARQDKATVEGLLDDPSMKRDLTVYTNFYKK